MPDIIYLNNASCGLVPAETLAAANKLYAELETNSSTRAENWRFNEEGRIREAIASFLFVPAANIAMIPNFSWAINGVVQSLKGTERILMYRNDYPSFLEPFKINGFDITWLDSPDGFTISEDEIKEHITGGKVDIVALSHVQWNSGFKIDLQAIGDLCKAHGVLFIVDATQSMGAQFINLSELNIDVFISSNYKWMNAGFGTGVMYIADSFLEKYPPVVGGHNSFKMVGDKWMYTSSAQSYEPGHPNIFGLTVLESAIRHKQELGVSAIQAHNMELTQLFLDNIKDLPVKIIGDYGTEHRSSIVIMKDEDGLGDWIKQHGIVITQRNGLLRVGIHYYNTEADVMALVNCLKEKYIN